MLARVRLSLVVTLALAPSGAPANGASEAPFERRDLRTEHPIVQATLPVRLDASGGRHLVVVTSPDRRRVVVELFAPDASGAPGPTPTRLALPSDVVALDVAQIDDSGRQALYFLTPKAILRLDPETGAVSEERRLESIYRRPAAGRLLEIDFMRNRGGSTAPVPIVPDFDEVRAGSSVLPIAPETRHDEGGASYHPTGIHLSDLDLDGIDDLFILADDSIETFHGTASGFASEAVVQKLGLRLDARLRGEELGDRDQSDVTTRRVVAVDDFDGDGLVDILIESTRRAGVLDRETSHELHLGQRGPSGVAYDTEPDTTVRGDAPLGGVRSVDIDGDGRLDLAAGSIDIGLGTIVSALLTGTVDFDVHFFRLSESGYAKEPNSTREARIEFDLSEGKASIPVFVLADVDGDGDHDLVVREDHDELLVYSADGSPELFDDEPRKIALPLPDNGQLVRHATLNGDQADDLLVRYEGRSGHAARRTVTLLLGRMRDPAAPD